MSRRSALGITGVAVLAVVGATATALLMTSQPAPVSGPGDEAFAASVAAVVVDGEPADVRLPADLARTVRGAAYVALRADGERIGEARGAGADAHESFNAALAGALEAADPDLADEVDTVEAILAGDPERMNADEGFDNIDRGVSGLSVILPDGREFIVGPTEMIADNTSFERVLERMVEDEIVTEGDLADSEIRRFPATQLLVHLDDGSVTRMRRGNQLVSPDVVSAQTVGGLAEGMSGWLVRNLADDGRMVYEYFPSRGDESGANNMIRQWMATIALIRVAERADDAMLFDRIGANIDYNLAISYRTDGDLGLVADPDGDVKLGAVALAALAISQHPERDRWADEEAALRRTVDHLWQADGSFVTFHVPAGRNDNQNFYPGEALLLWAVTLEDGTDADLLDRFMRSFEHYRDWHREQPNPAFVPWHSMAYEAVWRLTRDDDLRDFVFEMNDWLVATMQQWEDAPSDDVAGRFYSPDHPDYGPPHASSDGVYLEGLVAAYRLATAADDAERAEAYRTAIVRGIRHLMQLQFADSVDMYYVSQRERVAGGLRTTVYDNRIRVDNVQHGLLAVLDALEAFAPQDFRIED